MTAKSKNNIIKKILVNMITGTRTLGTILMIPIYLKYGVFVASIVALCIFLTDCIDGFLARKLHVQTFFGSILDAVSDKTFVIVCLLILSKLNPTFISVVIVEIGILILNYESAKRNNNVQSSKFGKVKMALLAITIVSSLLLYSSTTIKELINNNIFNYILDIPVKLTSTILIVPLLIVDISVFIDYQIKASRQDKAKIMNEENLIERKNHKEILSNLFDTNYYIKHKNDGIKGLLYKEDHTNEKENK